MRTGGNSGLPSHQLCIINSQYPFRNPQMSKIFDISVVQQLQIEPKMLHKLVQSNMLISVVGLEVIAQNKTKIRYQYIDTCITKYIRQFLHQNIEIKLQKFYIQLRNITNKFVMKNINVMKALNYKNIGVKVSDLYRQTMFVGSANKKQTKQIVMPNFKVFIDLSKCQVINKGQNIGRIVIETDKMIYSSICSQINNLVRNIENQQVKKSKNLSKYPQFFYNKPVKSLQIIPEGQVLNFKSKTHNTIQQNENGFTNNVKKRKRRKENEKIEILDKEDSKSERIIPNRFQIGLNFDSKELNSQVNQILQKSRKTLQTFKRKIKNFQ